MGNDSSPPPTVPGTNSRATSTVPGRHILIVDDEADLVDLLVARLEMAGFSVSTALNGEEGLATAKQAKPDLILLDVMMPKMDGLEVCRRLKDDTHYRHIPIVLLTARTQEKDQADGREAGADAYITKPFDANALLTLIHQHLSP